MVRESSGEYCLRKWPEKVERKIVGESSQRIVRENKIK